MEKRERATTRLDRRKSDVVKAAAAAANKNK